MHSVCCCSLVWRRSSFENGTPMTYFCPALDPPLGGFGPRVNTNVRGHCCCSLLVWKRSFLKKGTPMTYFCPALDPPLDRSGRKTTTLVRDLEYLIHTKFHQNPSTGSWEEVENVNSLTDDGRTDERRTDDGRRTTRDHNRSLEPLAPVP